VATVAFLRQRVPDDRLSEIPGVPVRILSLDLIAPDPPVSASPQIGLGAGHMWCGDLRGPLINRQHHRSVRHREHLAHRGRLFLRVDVEEPRQRGVVKDLVEICRHNEGIQPPLAERIPRLAAAE
jgi:hypothetical protein